MDRRPCAPVVLTYTTRPFVYPLCLPSAVQTCPPTGSTTHQAPVKAKLDKATAELEEAVAAAEEARREFEGDFTLQLMSFRQKGVLRQAAFVGSILIANQAVYQAILAADSRGGNPAIALGGLVASAALLWFYGYRPIKL